MAERRMFAKSIVTSDAFLDMPMSARCLYFTLGMFADDDGFVNNPKSIIRQIGATEDDMKVLLMKKFVIAFESGVIVIKHWRINNLLRSDRHHDTNYKEEMALLSTDENGVYTKSGIPSDNQLATNGIPSDNQRYTEDRIGKDSIDILPTVVSKVPYQDVVDAYHEECPSLPKVIKLTDTRKKHIKARLSNHTLEELREVFRRVEHSNFCKGDNQNGWTADFDFITRSEDSIAKILEGKYDNRENHGTNGNNKSAGRSAPRVTDKERQSIAEWEARQRELFAKG